MSFFAEIRTNYHDNFIRKDALQAALAYDSIYVDLSTNAYDVTVPDGITTYVMLKNADMVEWISLDAKVYPHGLPMVYAVTRDLTNLHDPDPSWPIGTEAYVTTVLGVADASELLDVLDVGTTLKFSTQLAGGYHTCTFTATGGTMQTYERLHKYVGAHVRVKDSLNRTVYEGYITNTSFGTDAISLNVSAVGYYAKANDLFYDMIYYYPESTTNLVPNPSFENNVTDGGWTSIVHTRTRSTAQAKYGSASMYIAASTTSSSDAVTQLNRPCALGTTYTFSFYAKVAVLTQVTPYIQIFNGNKSVRLIQDVQLTGINFINWQRYTFTFTTPSENILANYTMNFMFCVPNTNIINTGLYVDGVQVEQRSTSTDYCDGSLGATYYWNGTAHNSTSYRVGYELKQKQILKDIIDFVPSWNKNKSFVDDADYIVGNCDFSGEKVKRAIEYVLSFGVNVGGVARNVYLSLYNNRLVKTLIEPDISKNPTPDWLLYVSPTSGGETHASLDLTGVFNKIYSVYSDKVDGIVPTIPSEDAISQARYDVREGLLQSGEYALSEALSLELQEAALYRYRYPSMVLGFVISGVAQRQSGMLDFVYMLRAGDIILIADSAMFAPGIGSHAAGQQAYKTLCYVVFTEYDALADTLRIDVGSGDTSFELLMGRLGISGGLT